MAVTADSVATGSTQTRRHLDLATALGGKMAAEAGAHAPEESMRLPGSFWTYFTASVVSWLGDGMLIVGFPLLAASITESPLWIAVVVFAQRLAPLLLSLPAGALVD